MPSRNWKFKEIFPFLRYRPANVHAILYNIYFIGTSLLFFWVQKSKLSLDYYFLYFCTKRTKESLQVLVYINGKLQEITGFCQISLDLKKLNRQLFGGENWNNAKTCTYSYSIHPYLYLPNKNQKLLRIYGIKWRNWRNFWAGSGNYP